MGSDSSVRGLGRGGGRSVFMESRAFYMVTEAWVVYGARGQPFWRVIVWGRFFTHVVVGRAFIAWVGVGLAVFEVWRWIVSRVVAGVGERLAGPRAHCLRRVSWFCFLFLLAINRIRMLGVSFSRFCVAAAGCCYKQQGVVGRRAVYITMMKRMTRNEGAFVESAGWQRQEAVGVVCTAGKKGREANLAGTDAVKRKRKK